MLKQYTSYLKNNPRGYWFKRKLYGWGWTPARWQGWAVLFVFTLLVILNIAITDLGSQLLSDPLSGFVIRFIALVVILIFICWKTGEKPRWQWGYPKRDEGQER